jgi:hypothetical protein
MRQMLSLMLECDIPRRKVMKGKRLEAYKARKIDDLGEIITKINLDLRSLKAYNSRAYGNIMAAKALLGKARSALRRKEEWT